MVSEAARRLTPTIDLAVPSAPRWRLTHGGLNNRAQLWRSEIEPSRRGLTFWGRAQADGLRVALAQAAGAAWRRRPFPVPAGPSGAWTAARQRSPNSSLPHSP